LKIRPASAGDIPELIALERASPSAAHWTEPQYRDLFQNPNSLIERITLVAVADAQEDILGFLVARRIAHEWELENLVVTHQARRRGLGTKLLEALRTHIQETKGESLLLEVRESNAPARTFYESIGFRQTGRRLAYYGHPSEDAILYRWP
jgi:ribosomal-protein-alanine acetyltransferase